MFYIIIIIIIHRMIQQRLFCPFSRAVMHRQSDTHLTDVFQGSLGKCLVNLVSFSGSLVSFLHLC